MLVAFFWRCICCAHGGFGAWAPSWFCSWGPFHSALSSSVVESSSRRLSFYRATRLDPFKSSAGANFGGVLPASFWDVCRF